MNYWKKSLHIPESMRVLMYIDKVYHDLLKYIIFKGSANVPDHVKKIYFTEGCISKEQALEMAYDISSTVLIPWM